MYDATRDLLIPYAARERRCGGEVKTLTDAQALSARELFAWNLCQTIKELPAKYRFSRVEIVNTTVVSPTEIEYMLQLSDVEAVSGMKEGGFSRLVKEDGEWRIDR